jgi:hypothetical protein
MKKIRLAYLVSCYPMISMTFILREVRTLRHLYLLVCGIYQYTRPPF